MEFFDIRKIQTRTLSIQIENGAIEKPRYECSSIKSFRVLKNGFWGLFQGNVGEKEGLEMAKRNAIFRSDSDVIELRSEGSYVMKVKENPLDVPIEEKASLIRDLEDVIKDVCVSTKVTYFDNVREFHYKDSFGSDVNYTVYRVGISVIGVGKGRTLQFYSQRLMRAGGFEVLRDATKVAEEVKKILPKLVDAKSPPSGKINVIMDQRLAGVFVHEAFGHAVEADHVIQGSSVLSDRIGEAVASKEVTIVDDPSIHQFGFCPFDDEGVKTRERVIVDQGILKSFLHTRETAKKLKGEPGNARAQGGEFPIVRMSNTYLKPRDYKFDELLEACKSGVYLIGSRGGETNPATGFFHFNAQFGYKISNGEISEMIRDVSLSGNTLDVLREIKIGEDLKFDPGFCGKSSQHVPVSDGAPHILCRAIVGGA